MKIVIVGHVDHGKSTLIGRLLFDTNSLPSGKMEEVRKVSKELGREVEFAFLMDQLQEEREGGLTIDTTQTFFKTDKRNYVIIDAPGHVEFIKNMITGASQTEAAFLLVDAEEGVREQTKRHGYILNLLGIKQILVLINKMDLVQYSKIRYEQVKKDILEFLEKVNIFPFYIIPISAKHGDNISKKSSMLNWFDGPTVIEALDSLVPEIDEDSDLCFPVQDIYVLPKKGKVIVGRVESGCLRKGQDVWVLPGRYKRKVKRILRFQNDKLKKAEKTECIGVILDNDHKISRGSILVDKDTMNTSDRIITHLFWMAGEPCKVGNEYIFKCATQEVKCIIDRVQNKFDPARLEIIEDESFELYNAQIAEVWLALRNPVFTASFKRIPQLGRFVLEKDGHVVSAGTIF